MHDLTSAAAVFRGLALAGSRMDVYYEARRTSGEPKASVVNCLDSVRFAARTMQSCTPARSEPNEIDLNAIVTLLGCLFNYEAAFVAITLTDGPVKERSNKSMHPVGRFLDSASASTHDTHRGPTWVHRTRSIWPPLIDY